MDIFPSKIGAAIAMYYYLKKASMDDMVSGLVRNPDEQQK